MMPRKRPPPVEAGVVTLAGGGLTVVDSGDLPLVSQFFWSEAPAVDGRVYAACGSGLMHRLILGAPKGVEVDHISGNTLDNRRANLRLCTRGQNRANTRPCNGVSTYKGIKRMRGKWQARIWKEGREVHLGTFAEEADAARAYDAAAMAVHGGFAWLNFPDEASCATG